MSRTRRDLLFAAAFGFAVLALSLAAWSVARVAPDDTVVRIDAAVSGTETAATGGGVARVRDEIGEAVSRDTEDGVDVGISRGVAGQNTSGCLRPRIPIR